MTTNQFYPFGIAGGANVLSPSAYQALSARLTGFVAGVAPSEQLNTVWRQSSVVSTMIAQFIADNTGGDVLDDGDVAGLEAKFIAAVQSFAPAASLIHFGHDTGSANSLSVNVSPSITAYTDGMVVVTVPAATNTSSAANLNADTVGAKTIVRDDGTPIQQGDIVGGVLSLFVYDLANTVWRMFGILPDQSLIHEGADSSVTVNTITVTVTPPIASYKRGSVFAIKIANTVTGAATANINGLGAKSITRSNGSANQANDLVAGQDAILVYDGTNLQIANFSPANIPARSTQQFLASASFTVPADVYRIHVRVWGAGGGGGGSAGSGGAGSGGGGGGYAESIVAVTPGQVIAVTVGSGGAGGTSAPTNGSNGGASSFGSLVSATGGGFGSAGNGGLQTSAAGAGGTGSGSFTVSGGSAGIAFLVGSIPAAGIGGTGGMGSGSPTISIGGVGAPGVFPGGGANAGSAGTFAGAKGADGLVVIEY